jgi:hypothetical protein
MLAASLSLLVMPNHIETGFPAAGQFSGDLKSPAGGNGVAIAPKWVLSAAHAGGGAYFVQGKTRTKIKRRIDHPQADLCIYELATPLKQYSPVLLAEFKKLKGRELWLVGFGETGEQFDWGFDGRQRTGGTKRSVTNRIDEERLFDRYSRFKSQILVYDLDDPTGKSKGSLGSDKATQREGTIGAGDSGSPMFVMEAGKPRVVGINAYLLGNPLRSDRGFAWGKQAGAVYVFAYRAWLENAMSGKK